MKGHNILHPKREQPKPLPAPFNEQRWEDMLPYEKSEYFLAEARLKSEGPRGFPFSNAIDSLHRRAAALCDIVGEAAYSESGSEMPGDSLAIVMDIIREDIRVASVLARKMPEARLNSSSGDGV
jgi:hypothetical protein